MNLAKRYHEFKILMKIQELNRSVTRSIWKTFLVTSPIFAAMSRVIWLDFEEEFFQL
jgi:hypothetical protein